MPIAPNGSGGRGVRRERAAGGHRDHAPQVRPQPAGGAARHLDRADPLARPLAAGPAERFAAGGVCCLSSHTLNATTGDIPGLIDTYGYLAVFVGASSRARPSSRGPRRPSRLPRLQAGGDRGPDRGVSRRPVLLLPRPLQRQAHPGALPQHGGARAQASTRCSRAGMRRSSSASASCTASASSGRCCWAWDACRRGNSCSTTSSARRSGRR